MASDNQFYQKLYPQSLYRRPDKTKSKDIPIIDITLPNLSHLNEKHQTELALKITEIVEIIQKAILPEQDISSRLIKDLIKQLKLGAKATLDKKNEPLSKVWNKIEIPIINATKQNILKDHTSDILIFFKQKITYIVNQYARHLPRHVANSEKDDLFTIAQLEFLETFKSWKPDKSQEIWPLAYTRVNGAMKDHIRYISKSDPTRFYEWVTDAANLLLAQQNTQDFEIKIENGVQLKQAMEVLSPRERTIVTSYTQKDMTFHTISESLGLSESQTSRLYKKAIEKVKKEISK